MARTTWKYLLWTLMLVGCSSQPFCDFHDTAPIIVLPVPDNVASQYGWGTVMLPVSWTEAGVELDFLAVSGGPRSQTELFQLAEDEDLDIQVSQVLTSICDRDDANDPNSTCYERHAGVGLGFRSVWDDGQNCLAVGMAGHLELGGISFWCASGTRHRTVAFLLTVDWPVRALTSVMPPNEKIFLGTDRSLHLLEGSETEMVRVLWEYDGLPSQSDPIDALSAMTVEEEAAGYLLAVGFAGDEQRSVLVVQVDPPLEGEEDATLIPRACITRDEPSFGSVVKLARLEPNGPPMLLAASRWGTEDRVENLYIYELDLDVAPEDVVCEDQELLTLSCEMPQDEPSASCPERNTGFGSSVDVGDLDDTSEYEVLVGCPGCTANGYSRAGAGIIFRPAREDDVPIAVLIDSSEDRAEAQLGAGVGIAQVGNRDEPILAGPGESSLLMFLCSGTGDAPPEWDRPTNQTGSLVDARCRSEDN